MPSFADLNLRHLRAVPVIAEHGGISAASSIVHLSQPAVTQGVAKLEAQLGRPLFDRRPDGMTPTAEGRMLTPRIEAAFGHITAAVRAVRRPGQGGPQRPDQLISAAQVRALLAFAAHGGYAAAAQATGLAQPSLHRAIGDLEALCGVRLVERRGRGTALSPAGRRLVRGFRLASAEFDAGLSDLAGASGPASGRVAVGALPLSRSRVVPRAVARFHREHPGVLVSILDGPYPELLERLRDGEVDLVIGALRSPAPAADVEQRPLFEDELLIVGRSGHPLAGKPAPSLADAARYPWIVAHEGAPMRAQWRALFAGAKTAPAAKTAKAAARA